MRDHLRARLDDVERVGERPRGGATDAAGQQRGGTRALIQRSELWQLALARLPRRVAQSGSRVWRGSLVRIGWLGAPRTEQSTRPWWASRATRSRWCRGTAHGVPQSARSARATSILRARAVRVLTAGRALAPVRAWRVQSNGPA